MKDYDVHEVLATLQNYYITDSPQMVTRWIREGKIQGFRGENRKEGYRVSEDALFEYIEELRPGLPAIMEVYEEHIKRLRHKQHAESNRIESYDEMAELKRIYESKEKQYEKEIKELREKVHNLEMINVDLTQEKQMIEMNMIEIMENHKKLFKENYALDEDIKIYTELYGILDKEFIEIKNNYNAPVASEEGSKKLNENAVSTLEEKNIKITLEEFKKISYEVVSKFDLKLEETIIENQLNTIYEQIFENGSIKPDIITTNGTFKCLYTEKEYKQVKRLINNAIKYTIEKLNDQSSDGEQVEIIMANE